MPLLSIESNCKPRNENVLLRTASTYVATLLAKREAYVMVRFAHNPNMMFAGSGDPLALLTLKSIELPRAQTEAFSAKLCRFIGDQLGVPSNRTYIEFNPVERGLWGFDNRTFEKK